MSHKGETSSVHISKPMQMYADNPDPSGKERATIFEDPSDAKLNLS